MRLATWNVNSVTARLPRLLDWLASTKPDVVCLQEIKCAADAFPAGEIAALGYQSAAHGDGRWNGVALLSRVGLEDVTRGLADEWWPATSTSRRPTTTCSTRPRSSG
jgi:exodeoxyribonuclease-3